MKATVRQDTEDNASGWSSNGSTDPDHPGTQRGNVGQRVFFSLPIYMTGSQSNFVGWLAASWKRQYCSTISTLAAVIVVRDQDTIVLMSLTSNFAAACPLPCT